MYSFQNAIIAVKKYNLKELYNIIENDKNIEINKKDIEGNTMLIYACDIYDPKLKNGENIIKYLVSKKCDINILNNHGESAMTIMCKKQDITMLSFLIENGGNINLYNPNIVSKYGDITYNLYEPQCSNFYYKLDLDSDDIIKKNKNTATTQFYDPYSQNNQSSTPLSDYGKTYNKNAKHEITGFKTVLKYAYDINNIILFNHIIKLGANINFIYNPYDNHTLLLTLCYNYNTKNDDFILSLIINNVNINYQDINGNTALMYLCNNIYTLPIIEKIFSIVPNNIIDCNLLNNENYNALLLACMTYKHENTYRRMRTNHNNYVSYDEKKLDIIEILIQNGANTDECLSLIKFHGLTIEPEVYTLLDIVFSKSKSATKVFK